MSPRAKDPDWAREELILALDLYMRRGRRQLDDTDPGVIDLSRLLNTLNFQPTALRTPKFRNPSGVSMKLGNFWSIDPSYSGSGLRHGGKLELAIWAEFVEEPDRLRAEAERIKATG
jgi:5-methylcytosine-specific restriction protein A